MNRIGTRWLAAGLLLGFLIPTLTAQRVRATLVAEGLDRPVFVTAPPADSQRLFIPEQYTGRIRIVENGVLLATPFLDLGSLLSTDSEQGLLGLAFHPSYSQTGRFFVYYTDVNDDAILASYQVDPLDPNRADPLSAQVLLTLTQPSVWHNGGMLAFGPQDGYLYLGPGDGGVFQNAQRENSLLGKLLRIDVDQAAPYAIPPSNPFVGQPGAREEIWAMGLRNPWRFSFDRLTGDLWIGDVGLDDFEEIDFQAAASLGGENYGWYFKEGTNCLTTPSQCQQPGLVDPLFEYPHGGTPFRCSINGGYVYRGTAIPGLQGAYFFGDHCSGQIWSLRQQAGAVTVHDRTNELARIGTFCSSFGEDDDGELHVCNLLSGKVYRIDPDLMVASVTPLTGGQPATISLSRATPGERIFLFYGLNGPGLQELPSLQVWLGVAQPRLFATRRADASGRLSLTAKVPAALSQRTVWLQAAEARNTSNLLEESVQ